MFHTVYLSFESGNVGRNYIGKHSSEDPYDEYKGSFKDAGFTPSGKIILEYSKTEEGAIDAEIRWQKVFQVVEDPQFANQSYQTSTKFKYNSKGRSLPEETRNKIREANRGRTHSFDTKQKLSEQRKGEKNPMFGRSGEQSPRYGTTHTDETKEKMSAAHKGKKLSLEHKKKVSDATMGRKHREETRKKISEALTGRERSKTHRENLSKSHKGSEPSKKSGRKSMAQRYTDPDHPELGQHAAPVLVRMQKKRGYPHGPENRVRIK
jgi:hypothetical protein